MSDLVKQLWAWAKRDTAMSEFGPDEHIAGIAADEIKRLKAELREAHYNGYMAGMGDSEDYDHDPVVMEKEAWKEYLDD